MKRFCMIEIAMILASFLALVKGLSILANVIMLLLIGLTFLINSNLSKSVTVFGSLIIFLLMRSLANFGGLYNVYDGLSGVLFGLSIHLVLMYEYLDHKHNISEAFEPFLIFIIFTFGMLLTAILLKDNSIFALVYPKGMVSLLVLIMLMCMPYLLTMACSFLMHD